MRAWFLAGCMGLVSAFGCASSNAGHATSDAGGEDASEDTSDDASADKLTWTFVYATYFGKGTPGHCGTAGCHGTTRQGFLCNNKATCYTSITTQNPNVGGKMVNLQTP